MSVKQKQKHMVDFLFPVALFFAFAISALAVILFATKVYRSSVENSALNYTSRTSLSYITEKIHQNDANGSVSIGTFDGCEALLLTQEENGVSYTTYIYVYEQELKEIFLTGDVEVPASSGSTILAVKDFTMEKISDKCYRFSCTDEEGLRAETIVTAVGANEGGAGL